MNKLNSSVKCSEILVRAYRQILIWPLLLKEVGPPSGRQFERWLELLKPVWGQPVMVTPATGVDDPEKQLGNEPNFEEMVYFHPFVRDFLYGDGRPGTDERSLLRLRREDVTGMEIELADDAGQAGGTFAFDVPRVELYLCKPLVALLVFEISGPRQLGEAGLPPFNLETALKVQSQFRQAYPPFFKKNQRGNEVRGNCPCRVTFTMKDGMPLVSNFEAGRQHFAEFTQRGAEPPVVAHWRQLLWPGKLKIADQKLQSFEPFESANPENLDTTVGYYQQIIDDRIPGMTYLRVDEPRLIAQGDFDRLVFADMASNAPFPFSDDFFGPNRAKYVYDRFWHPDANHDTGSFQLNTRYLCSGYQFVVIGAETNGLFKDILPIHFHRHYFRMGLIVHFHRAALLKFADEIAEAIKLVKNKDPEEEFGDRQFRERITHLQMTFLKFRSRCWFNEVSNQLQGGELFAWWAEKLGNERLFKHVDETCQRLYEGLSEYESRRLTSAAFRGLPLTILIGAASLVFASLSTLTTFEKILWAAGLLFIAVAVTELFLRLIGHDGLLPKKLYAKYCAWLREQWNRDK